MQNAQAHRGFRLETLTIFLLLLLAAVPLWAALPPTEEEATVLGRAIDAGFAKKDLAPFNQALDGEALLDRTCQGVAADSQKMQKFLEGFRQGISKSFSEFARQLQAQGSYKFLRVQDAGGKRTLLFRVLSREGALNYHRLLLERRGNQIRVVDIYIFASSEKFSDTLRRILLPAAAEVEKSALERLVTKEGDLMKYYKQWSQLPAMATGPRLKEFMGVYNQLPAGLQQEKFILLLRIKAAMQADDKNYQEALTLWRKAYPNDPSQDLMSIDYYFMKKDYDQTLASLERLDKSVGGDPYLRVMSGAQQKLAGRLDQAKKSAQAAIAEDDTLSQAYDLLIAISLEEKQYADTVKLLTQVERIFGRSLKQVVASDPDYQEFRRSPEYRQWTQGGAGRNPFAGAPTRPPVTTPPATTTRPGIPKTGPAAPPSNEPELRGIAYSAARPVAIISGESVLVGDIVKGHKVIKIERDRVTLETPDGKPKELILK